MVNLNNAGSDEGSAVIGTEESCFGHTVKGLQYSLGVARGMTEIFYPMDLSAEIDSDFDEERELHYPYESGTTCPVYLFSSLPDYCCGERSGSGKAFENRGSCYTR